MSESISDNDATAADDQASAPLDVRLAIPSEWQPPLADALKPTGATNREEDVIPHNRGTRRKPRYVGLVSYKGHTKWVGTHASIAAYKQAEHERLIELREEVDLAECRRIPTVTEFAGAVVHPNGRITMTWPEGQRVHKETGRRPSTVRRMRDGLKPLVRDFGDHQLDSFSRQQALTWALPRGRHVQQSARRFFNHALDRELIASNVFTRLGVIKRTRRIDRPGFEVISDAQYERLCRCARASRDDSYGLILEGVILAIGEAAMRPGEIFALNHSDIDYTTGLIHIRRQLDLASGVTDWPKDDEPRDIAMSPKLRSHLEIMPRLSEEILFPTPRGCYMPRSTWSAHWHSVRAAAQIPGLEFYELRHRAIQWMIDPPDDGGLGLHIQTTAHIAGHRDGGFLV
jgi:integrase